MGLKPQDAFETKKAAERYANQMRKDKRYPVQHVRVSKRAGRLKYMVSIGGKNSSNW